VGRRGGAGGALNTVSGLLVMVGVIVLIAWGAKRFAPAIAASFHGLGAGGSFGTASPVGGGQFGPSTSPLAALGAALTAPLSGDLAKPPAQVSVLDTAVARYGDIFRAQGKAVPTITDTIARSLPRGTSTDAPPVIVPVAGGYTFGGGVFGVARDQRFLGFGDPTKAFPGGAPIFA
jgi:hypothetical protein